METRRVSIIWDGPKRDILTLLSERTPLPYGADIADADERVILYRLLDDREEATGAVIGIEIEDFLGFDHWEAIPDLPERWQAADRFPLPPVELLKQVHAELCAESQMPALA